MRLVRFNSKRGYPVARNLFYRCKSCGETIPSQPNECMGCSCGNIFIDVDYARISIKRNSDIQLLKKKTKLKCTGPAGMFRKKQYKVKLRGRSGIEYSEGRKKLLLSSEFLAGEAGIVIYSRSLKTWEPPFESEELSEDTKEKIKTRVIQSLAKHRIPVEWV